MASFSHPLSRKASRPAEPPFAPSGTGAAPSGEARGTLHFLRHFGEMVLAMVAGMIVLGPLERVMLAAAGTSASDFQDTAPEVVALVMAFNMTVGMAVWMRHRGHSWPRVEEMGGAMFVPAVAVIVLFWSGAIDSDAMLPLEHVAMLPAMLLVMLFHPSEYSRPVHSHRPRTLG